MPRTALILEDSTTQARFIARMLERLGWTPVHCEEMAQAHECLRTMTVDAMFLDIFIGNGSTLGHIDEFRAAAPSTPMVLMTAGTQSESVGLTLDKARKSGADHVLRKPFNETAVENVLNALGQDAEAGEKRKHILVIDDSQTIRTITGRGLNDAGYRVSEAASMEAAFVNIDIAHVDLVLCDVFMPGMGGLMGMSQIKTTWPSVKIIAMSGGLPQQVREQDALQATRLVGADAQLVKPFSQHSLTALVDKVLNTEEIASARMA